MKLRTVLLAIIVALLQVSMHAIGGEWVIPNLVLIFVVWNAPKYSLTSMTGIILLMGIILEVASIMPTGLEIMELFLVLLVLRYVIHSGQANNKWTFQIAILTIVTILTNILAYATLPAGTIAQDIGYVVLRIALELLYNCSILLIVMAFSSRYDSRDQYYHLPGIR
jgi:cell shape-determining protein MreD